MKNYFFMNNWPNLHILHIRNFSENILECQAIHIRVVSKGLMLTNYEGPPMHYLGQISNFKTVKPVFNGHLCEKVKL